MPRALVNNLTELLIGYQASLCNGALLDRSQDGSSLILLNHQA